MMAQPLGKLLVGGKVPCSQRSLLQCSVLLHMLPSRTKNVEDQRSIRCFVATVAPHLGVKARYLGVAIGRV